MDKPISENTPQKTLEEVVQTEQLSQDIPATDLNFLIDSKEAMLIRKTPYANAMLYITAGIVVTFITWASFSEVDEVVKAPCTVVSTEPMQTITTQNVGTLQEILVNEGDKVKKGQLLAKLDPTADAADVKELSSIITSKQALASLYKAEATNAPLTFPESVQKDPVLVSEITAQFQKDQKARDEAVGPTREILASQEEQLQMMQDSIRTGVYDKYALIPKKQEISKTKIELNNLNNSFAKEAQKSFNEVTAELNSLNQRLVKADNNLKLTEIRSPVEGLVNQIDNLTVGSAIQSGMKLFEIAPDNASSQYVFNCRTPVKDKAFVHAACVPTPETPCNNPETKENSNYLGDKAIVMVDTFPFAAYGSLVGHVERVNLGVTEAKDEKTQAYFETIIKTDKNYVDYNGDRHDIVLHTTAQANIVVGKKTVMAYLMKPFTKASYNALTER